MVSVCANCKGLQRHLRNVDSSPGADAASWQWTNTTLPSLRRSTNGGCRACALLLQGVLLHHDRFAGVREDSVRIAAESFTSQHHLSVEVRWKPRDDDGCGDHGRDHGYPDLKLEFFTDQDGQSPFSAIGLGRHISDNPLQDAGLFTARGMIKNCLSSHHKCRHSRPTTLPRRVLDVLYDDGAKGVRLHESDFNQAEQRYEFGEYLALSHCWGTGRGILKTTRSSLQAHKKSIPWSSLPRTFQDAISLTRSLGFRWLFIDALCLVQDDVSEKLEESLKMDQVFANTFLTIAATSSLDSTRGLFPSKPPSFKIQATDSRGSLHKIYVREQPSHHSFKAPFDEGAHFNDWELPFNTSEEANSQTPLLKRAWAYAERLLSPRVLHFTQSEMILECRQAYQCECGRIEDSNFDSRATDSVKQEFASITAESGDMANGNGIDRRIDSMASQLASASLADVAQDLTRKRENALQLWSYIVTEYTARRLTYDEDRLVAITAVAKLLLEPLRSGYIAGQWTCSLLGLLWYPNDATVCRRPRADAGRNIPSWSWASVEGSPIFFDNASAMDLACTASFPSERGRNQPWSPTAGDRLELTAAMAAEVVFRTDGPSDYVLTKNNVSVDFRPDIIPLRGEDALQSGEALVCVLASMTFRSSIIGFVLKRSTSDPQIYRRVGRFECYECQRDDTDDDPEDAESLFSLWFPEIEDMTQLDDSPQHTFIIV